MFISKLCFFSAIFSFLFNMKYFFNMLIILEMFSFGMMFFIFLTKNQLFFFSIFILVMSAIMGLMMFFINLMCFGNEKSFNQIF